MVLGVNEAHAQIPLGSHYFPNCCPWSVWMCWAPSGTWYSQNKNQIELCILLQGGHLQSQDQVWVFPLKGVAKKLCRICLEPSWERGEGQNDWTAAKWAKSSSGEMQIDGSMGRKLERNDSLKFHLTFGCFALEKFGFDHKDGPYGTFQLGLSGGKIIRLSNLRLD